MSKNERLIKNKKRVQQHGEVFTPISTVNEMLDMEGLKENIEDVRKKILEPSVGEGVFLVEILKRRLKNVLNLSSNISEYENLSLLSLTTLYGIELLEDNAQKCVMNIYICFYNFYEKALKKYDKRKKNKVLDSARTIISANIAQGNFLTKKTNNEKPIVFSEWKEINNKNNRKNIRIIRTEYTLDEIYNSEVNSKGNIIERQIKKTEEFHQMSFFEYLDQEVEDNFNNEIIVKCKYIECNITDTYKEEMEEYDG
ncbi:methylase [Gemelliphila palaticanis]|uniref:Methylase n=1 Tax=Gemelliphila palaticanis TaxID=81950 RepID=A0ABX2SX68_9BACL|nr:methylase [Gemella palaticanis]MBF0714754.1 methylase [Gemella palaticanis]NYS46684.1 methylase [Gemella palaticanis]